jgi:hypothetical protein
MRGWIVPPRAVGMLGVQAGASEIGRICVGEFHRSAPRSRLDSSTCRAASPLSRSSRAIVAGDSEVLTEEEVSGATRSQ